MTGERTQEIDNELIDHVTLYLSGKNPAGIATASLREVVKKQVLVPTYYDPRYVEGMKLFLKENGLKSTTIGELIDTSVLSMREGHGSPSND